MSNDTAHTTESALQKLTMAFEYNETWAEAKKAVKNRTI